MYKTKEMLYAEIEKGVKQVLQSDRWKTYLCCMAKFHQYSVSNTLLIYAQKPDATYVAGFYTWKHVFHRIVKKGEKGIRILAPIIQKNEVEEIIYSYKQAVVFDVSQTHGEPLPTYITSLQQSVIQYDIIKNALLQISPVPIHFQNFNSSANGYYDTKNAFICIQDSLSESMTIKTCLHEIAHALLHHTNSERNTLPTQIKEIEAESIAYSVGTFLNIDTSTYSFPYIAGWLQERKLEEIQDSFTCIHHTTHQIITSLTPYLPLDKV